MKKNIKTLIKFIICFFCASGISLLIFFYEAKFSNQENFYSVSRRLCDGFFISGILFLTFGILLFCVNNGGFNFLSYVFYSIKHFLTNKKNLSENSKKSYFDYCTQEKSKRKNSPLAAVLCGIFFIILSLIVYFAFYNG